MTRTRKNWLALCLAAAIAGCGVIPNPLGGTDGGSTTVQPTWSSLYSSYLVNCKSCHSPGAPGRTSDTESTLDFSTAATAFTTVTTGMAAGLVGNQQACNGVRFISSGNPSQSLLVASIDSATRTAFNAGTNCDSTAVTDQVVKTGTAPPDGFVDALKQWITSGAPNN